MIAFGAFLREVRGHGAYPWQEHFATRLAEEDPGEDVPAPLDVVVPTGSGKTTVVDALVWALAAQAQRPPAERTVGVRIVWAIDRRILVDEVHRQASVLADRLRAAFASPTDPIHELAVRLELLKGDDAAALPESARGTPLIATRWRGGVTAPALAQHPLQAEVITSTVAQIGSRMLFRGYGLGDRSAPVGAALAACDATVCLDEAHLSEAFAQTATAVARRARGPAPLTAPMRVIRLSATPGAEVSAQRVDLADDDLAMPDLRRRLEAPKRATLVEPSDATATGQLDELVGAVAAHVDEGRRVVACVANTVLAARAVFDRVRATDVDAVLLVGPQRPVDRAAALDRRLVAEHGGDTTPWAVLFGGVRPARPLVVVATQTFEVGLDADVDALVTQSASASALAQRLGRLNRAGRLQVTTHAAGGAPYAGGAATIVRQTSARLYADDEQAAWEWLSSKLPRTADGDRIDVSVAALRTTPPPAPARVAVAPELTPEVERLLAQTAPRPAPMIDPDIEPFLRGVHDDPSQDVEICWRADLRPDDDSRDADTYRDMLLRLAPPAWQEMVQVSLVAARTMLGSLAGTFSVSRASRARLDDVEDVDGASPPPPDIRRRDEPREIGIPFFVRRGDDLLRGSGTRGGTDGALSVWQLRPGDRIVVPTTLGGVDEHGFSPDSRTATDVALDVVAADPRARPPVVRLTRGALDAALAASVPEPGPRGRHLRTLMRYVASIERRIDAARTAAGRADAIGDLVVRLAGHPALADRSAFASAELRRLAPRPPADVAELDAIALEVLGGATGPIGGDDGDVLDGGPSLVIFEDESVSDPLAGWVLVVPARLAGDRVRAHDASPPTLDAHACAVAQRARGFARAAGLPARLAQTVEIAARIHDHGKADQRMQAFFRGGQPLALADPLAKSIFGTDDRRMSAVARAASGLPARWRHEVASAAILRDAWARDPRALGDLDLDLAQLLVVAHHGHGHPLVPVPRGGLAARPFHAEAAGIAGTCKPDAVDRWDVEAALQRREQLLDRFGPWALAYLVSLLVLADRTVSAEGG